MSGLSEELSPARERDLDLIRRIHRGEKEAFTELVRHYQDRAVKIAFSITGNFEDAKDVSQEAFVKAYRALRRFEGRSSFATWFTRILMNAARDFLRRKKWRQFLRWKKNEAMENFFDNIPARGLSPAAHLGQEEMAEKISAAMAKLPFKQKWVFGLRFIDGMSLAEIEGATGMAEGTVKANLHFAVRKFKEAMGRDWQGGE